jgi:phosphoglycerate dehydrogenase-like enzyme
MKVYAVRRDARRSIEDVAFLGGPESVDEVIERSDYLLIAIPATPDTVGLMDRRRLGLMKSAAFLINVARAEIVDEDALYEALAERSIARARRSMSGIAIPVWPALRRRRPAPSGICRMC